MTWSPHAAETIVYSVGSDTGRTVIGASPGAAPVEWRGPVFSTRDSQRHMLRGVCVTDGMLMYLQHTGGYAAMRTRFVANVCWAIPASRAAL